MKTTQTDLTSANRRLPAMQMNPVLQGLDPSLNGMLSLFSELIEIPRASGKEEPVRMWIEGIAERSGWIGKRDLAGNLYVYVPSKGSPANERPVAIQSHMDMVVDPANHDFKTSPMRLERRIQEVVINGKTMNTEVIGAIGTTLGADNGIGLCAGLALALDPEAIHPPLELIFTFDEERGLVGAGKLEASLIAAKTMINLDSEEIGEICVGCAGGRRMRCDWSARRSLELFGLGEKEAFTPFEIIVAGLPGGHSGTAIHERRGNAIKILVKCLAECMDLVGSDQIPNILLAHINGGTADNAIPSSARAVFWLKDDQKSDILKYVKETAFQRLDNIDPMYLAQLKILVQQASPHAETPLPLVHGESVIRALNDLKDGVVAWSKDVAGFVDTSSTIGIIETTEDNITILCAGRSSDMQALVHIQSTMEERLSAFGGMVAYKNAYPGWKPNMSSPLLQRTVEGYKRLFDVSPKVGAIHAGLECGFIAEKIPGLDIVSFGPTITNPHSTKESVAIVTLKPFRDQLWDLAKDLAMRPL